MTRFGTAVILAGGKSLRMGFDKQLLKVNERRLMDNLITKLKEKFNEIIIVTNKAEYYIGLSDKIISDKIKDMGPLSGIHAGLKESLSHYVYFTACDMPNISLDYIDYMKREIEGIEVKACVTKLGQWIEPFNAFYSKDMVKNIEEHLFENRKSIFSLIDKVETHYIEEKEARRYSPNWDMFLNLNTREELDRYTRKL